MGNNSKLYSSLILILLFTGCSKKYYPNSTLYSFHTADSIPDYSQPNYWAAHPWKWDPSDSIPAPLRNSFIRDSVADVFFIHPTTLTDYSDQRTNATINDSALNLKTDYSTILYQASAFNEQTRVFAPRYRQAHLRTFFMNDTAAAAVIFDRAYTDIKQAFEYYLLHYNNGRPIIIAAHSQGTVHAGRLLKEYFEGKPLQQKLICAYLIGMPVRDNYFSTIPACKDANSTGCFVSWRTFKRSYTEPLFVAKENFKAVVTNPLTWTTDEQYAGPALNSGGILKNFNKLVPGVVDAEVHQNILWTSKPKFFGNIFLTIKNYHIADINLFYNNIRQNVQQRIAAYWKR